MRIATVLSHKKLLLVFTLWSAAACAQSAKAPDTPAGTALQVWLEAFNSGDKVRMQTYLSTYKNGPTNSVEGSIAFRNQTGGFQLLGVDHNEGSRLAFRVKEVAGPTVAVGKIEMTEGNPPTVERFSLRAVPPGLAPEDMTLQTDAAMRSRVIDGVLAKLNEFYVFPETAKKLEATIRARREAGAYETADADSFAARLTKDLQEVSRDKHLRVNFAPAPPPAAESGRSPEAEMAQRKAWMKRNNCAFEKAERLPSNVGYLKFNAFSDPSICGPTATAAMGFLASVDALIFDLRDNGGGDPKMVAYLSTYLFDKPTHLNDLYNRKENATTEFWTLPDVPGEKLAATPVYILTSKRTFSGAEEFSYNLKVLKRATIVGEVTGGGAHPTAGHRVDGQFFVGVPFARAINPITKANWEGTGVEPDVKVEASQALDEAVKLAIERIKGNSKKN